MKIQAKQSAANRIRIAALLFIPSFAAAQKLIPTFADAVAPLAGRIRVALGALSSRVSFSLTAALLASLPILFLLFVGAGIVSLYRRGNLRRFLSSLLTLFLAVSLLFSVTLWPGFCVPPLSEKLSFSAEPYSASELAAAVTYLSGLSGKPVTGDWERDLQKGFSALGGPYGFIPGAPLPKSDKSGVLSLFGAVGLYAFPFGEITLNADYPLPLYVFTAAHETAHACGFSREEEADFIAFRACELSGNPGLLSAAAEGLLGRLLPLLAELSPEKWEEVGRSLPREVREDYVQGGALYEKSLLPVGAEEAERYAPVPPLMIGYLRSTGILADT